MASVMPPKFKRTVSHEDLISAKNEETASLLEQKSGSEEDEDFFLNGPSVKPQVFNIQNDQIKQVRLQIAEVTETMKGNVSKILDRGRQLDTLQDASHRLSSTSVDFQNASVRMRRRAWAQHLKVKAIMAVGAVLLLVCLLGFPGEYTAGIVLGWHLLSVVFRQLALSTSFSPRRCRRSSSLVKLNATQL